MLRSIDDGERRRSPPVDTDAHERHLGIGRKYDVSVPSPSAATRERSIANKLGRTSVEINGFQLAFGEKSQSPAVPRPKRKDCALRSRERTGFQYAKRAYPDRGFAAGRGRGKSDCVSIWRKNRRPGKVTTQA